jgi:hypothetical protein
MLVEVFQSSGLVALAMLTAAVCIWPQPASPPAPPDHITDVKRKLQLLKPIDETAKRALEYGHTFLESAVKAKRGGKSFQADRLTDAADAMVHVAEHQAHLASGESGPKGSPALNSMADHLQHVYFRVQQANYFLMQSRDSRAAAFPKWARDFYQLAVQAYERRDQVSADENAKCAEEVVKCLEDLAQAATMTGPLPPPPPPPPERPPR